MAGKMEGSLSIMPRPLAPASLYALKNSLIDLRKTGHGMERRKSLPRGSLIVDKTNDNIFFFPDLIFNHFVSDDISYLRNTYANLRYFLIGKRYT